MYLQQAGDLLEKTAQTDAGAKVASKAVGKAIVHQTVLGHKDKASAAWQYAAEATAGVALHNIHVYPHLLQDVRVCAAYCLSHILKIHAPDSPYSTAQLQVIPHG